MSELQERVVDEVIRAQLASERMEKTLSASVASEVGGGEKPRGFFTKLGAPETGVGGEKPGGFFTTDRLEAGSVGGAEGRASGDGDGPSRGGAPSPLPSPGRRGEEGRLRLPDGESSDSTYLDPGDAWLGRPAVNRGGRPTVLTPELKEKLGMLLTVGMSRRQAAAYLGIDHTTIVKAAARDPEFRLSLKMAEDQATVNPLLTIISESRKNWRAAAWLLKYRGSWPVDYVEKTEEEKELEHQRRLADDAREAERDKLRLAAMQESLRWSSSQADGPMSLSERRRKRS